MSNETYEFADLNTTDVEQIRKAEENLNKQQNGEVILLAYKKK